MPLPGELFAALEREASRSLSFWRRLTGAQLLAGSFLALVLVGTVLLLTLPGLYTGDRLGLIDALFTATSAVCVTGLVVVDTATYFTPFGQGVLLSLVQLGGLGTLTLTSVMILGLGGRLTLRSEAVFAGGGIVPEVDTGRLLRSILRYTFAIEAVGAFLLWIAWGPELGALSAIWPAIFHAVSAFCNAGFSLFSDGLARFTGQPATLVVFMSLVVLGGLGFLVLEELVIWRRARGTIRLSLYTRLVLLSTAALILGGALLFLLFEWSNTFSGLAWWARPIEALFLSTMPRSSGFSTIDYGEVTSASLFLTMLLMFIGGSPGSTAGGLKTTTVAVLVALAIARLRGRTHVDAFGRTIPEATIQRAVGLVILVLALYAVGFFVLQLTELGGVPFPRVQDRWVEIAFESVSSLNIVGLSLGATTELSVAGKLTVAALMFIGRVGPLTLAASMAVAAERARVHYRFASEDVIIG